MGLRERVRILAEFRDRNKQNKKDRKPLLILLSLLVLLLINIFIFLDVPKKQPVPPGDENDLLEEIETGNVEKTKPPVITTDVKKKRELPIKPASAPKLSPLPKEEQPPLTIIVPNNIPLATQIYKVKKGDTLWNISMRFTGTPYNYPLVAQENDINNPDLIYPEQRILLKRAGKQ